MHSLFAFCFASLVALSAPLPAALAAQGPPKAKAELFSRTEGDSIRAAIRIRIDPGWHLYHEELGDENAIGIATQLTFTGDGITWSKPRFPAPIKGEQPVGKDGGPAWVYEHKGTIVLHVLGHSASTPPPEWSLTIKGLTCEDAGSCIPYSAKLTGPGERGPDDLFASFPADLKLAEPAAAAPADEFKPFEDPEAHAKVELFVREVDGEARAAIRIALDRRWHLYHTELGPEDAVGAPTNLVLGGAGIAWGAPVWPAPIKIDQPVGKWGDPTWIYGHEGKLTIYARGKLDAGASVDGANVSIDGLTCEEQCIEFEARVRSSGRGSDDLFTAEAAALNAPPLADAPPVKKEQSLLTFLGLAVFWGVFALLMPCTYPMIPITISFFTKQASHNKSKQITLSTLYGLGIVLIFVLIGVVIGAPIIQFATNPWTNLVIGGAFVVFALSLFGLFDLQPPAFLMNMAGQARMTGGYLGVFLMGATLVITSFTCTAPFVGSLLSVGAASGNLGRIALGMGTFGLTMAIPFVALSLVPAKVAAMPKSGEWMHTLKVTLGFIELAAALKFLSNADVAKQWQILPRELFLFLWFGIFLVVAAYLFGMIRLHGESGEIGPGRLVSAVAMLLFSMHCLFGALGNQLDVVMTAIAPPYSAPRVAGFEAGGATVAARDHEIVKDDLDAAVTRANDQGKLVLINFTGHT